MLRKNVKSVWYVGLIPALISGVFVYIVTRWYERDGFCDGLDTAYDDWIHFNHSDNEGEKVSKPL